MPVGWGEGFIKFTTGKNDAVSLITADVLTQSSREMSVYDASNSLNLKFDITPLCLYTTQLRISTVFKTIQRTSIDLNHIGLRLHQITQSPKLTG
jgi:hypothetical protein